MRVSLNYNQKFAKMTEYLNALPKDSEVESRTLSVLYCLTSAAAAGRHISMRGDFIKDEKRCGIWRKVG